MRPKMCCAQLGHTVTMRSTSLHHSRPALLVLLPLLRIGLATSLAHGSEGERCKQRSEGEISLIKKRRP